jgi:hypothetical protein
MDRAIRFKIKDEYYTPILQVEPLLKYIPINSIIWCPFDKENSEYVKILSKYHKVIYSHIDDGKDFFDYEPLVKYDFIISNPPYSKKIKILERLYKLNKPFAMLMGLPILNYQEVGNFFLDKSLQLLIFDKKVSFDGNTSAFNTSYFCHKFLPKDIIFHHLEHNNSGINYKPSSMYETLKNNAN